MAAENKGEAELAKIKVLEINFTKLFINGEFVDAVSGKTFEAIDPRTGEVIARIAEGDKEDVDLAVKATREAFDHGCWPGFPGLMRRKMLLKFAELVQENVEELAALEAVNAGKLFSFLKDIDLPAGAETLRCYAGAADKIHGEPLKMSRALQGNTLQEPIGVFG